MDVAVYNARIMGAAHVENVANLACRAALSYRGVAHINFPADFQSQDSDQSSMRNLPHHVSSFYTQSVPTPKAEAVQARTATLLCRTTN